MANESLTIQGLQIKPDNTTTLLDISSYDDYSAAVEGYIEAVDLVYGADNDIRYTMYVNEEYLLGQFNHATDVNYIAMTLAGVSGRVDLVFQGILGPVLLVGPVNRQTGEHDKSVPQAIITLASHIQADIQEEI